MIYQFTKDVFYIFAAIVPAVSIGILGGALLFFSAFAIYKQRQLQNKQTKENAKKNVKKSNKRKCDPNRSEKCKIDHPKKCHDEKACRKMMTVNKINIYDITNEPDEFDYLKNAQRCRCYSV